MAHANPGLRPGLSSAVPTGLDNRDGRSHAGALPRTLHHSGQTRLAFARRIPGLKGETWGTLRVSSLRKWLPLAGSLERRTSGIKILIEPSRSQPQRCLRRLEPRGSTGNRKLNESWS
jgi:hypothetical protein